MECWVVSSVLVSTTNGDVMKVFPAGERRAIGSHLVPELVAGGHEAVGTTRSAAKTGALRALGAEPVLVDTLDPDPAADVVAKAGPNPPGDAEDGVAALRHLEDGVTL
jgi:nucleoside-diphosphate-sugar epimerase